MVLENLIHDARANGVAVRLIGADREVHRELQQLGLIDLVGSENCLVSVTEAL